MLRFSEVGRDLRDTFVRASIVWGAVLLALTEVLSFFKALSLIPVALSWVFVALIAFPWKRRSAKPIMPNIDAIFLVPIAIILLVTLAVALAAAPNNFDSMTYHLGRVAHWMQNHDVRPYPTNID